MSNLTQKAIKNDSELGIPLFSVDEIFADPIFNCRGLISPMDVIDLTRDVAENGLQNPIHIQECTKVPKGFKYRIISGHRRHKAYQLNKHPKIPAILKINIDEFEARKLNAIENLKRQDLNMLQEARAISHYKEAKWQRDKIAKDIGMSVGWVQVRLNLLDLPEDIQQLAAAGIFTQENVRDLYTLNNYPEKQIAAVKKIKDAKERGEKRVTVLKKKSGKKKVRNRIEMVDMMSEIQRAYGNCFATRALAWASGNIDTHEFYFDLKEICDKEGLPYTIPTEETNIKKRF